MDYEHQSVEISDDEAQRDINTLVGKIEASTDDEQRQDILKRAQEWSAKTQRPAIAEAVERAIEDQVWEKPETEAAPEQE
jgi:hypothetical protein